MRVVREHLVQILLGEEHLRNLIEVHQIGQMKAEKLNWTAKAFTEN